MIIVVFNGLGIDLFVAHPVSHVESAQRSVQELSKKKPDLLLLIPLRGSVHKPLRRPY